MIIDIDVQVLHQTANAYLVTQDVSKNGVWLPKSQIEIEETQVKGIWCVSLPEWLALEKGMI